MAYAMTNAQNIGDRRRSLASLHPTDGAIAWLIGITAVLLPLNVVGFSERQAYRLREYIATVLETRPGGV